MFLFINFNQLILFPRRHKILRTLILNTFRQQLYTNKYNQSINQSINFNKLILSLRRHNIKRTLILNTFPQQVYTKLYHQIVYIDIICHITFLFINFDTLT